MSHLRSEPTTKEFLGFLFLCGVGYCIWKGSDLLLSFLLKL
jgi:hypothetical protein